MDDATAEAQRVGWHIFGKRLLNALFLTYRNFATFSHGQGRGNSRCLVDVYNHRRLGHVFRKVGMPRFGIHIGVGFCVARSTVMGNAKASIRGTGDGTATHAFLYIAKFNTSYFFMFLRGWLQEIFFLWRYGYQYYCSQGLRQIA